MRNLGTERVVARLESLSAGGDAFQIMAGSPKVFGAPDAERAPLGDAAPRSVLLEMDGGRAVRRGVRNRRRTREGASA